MKGATVALKSVQSANVLITGKAMSGCRRVEFVMFCREKAEVKIDDGL